MPNPKRKHTPHRRDCRRAANSKLRSPNLGTCLHCHKVKLPHTACFHCGFYNDEVAYLKK
ncbi:MAG: 50S ribosomal protein L32 [Endomicrobium sp.]|jgi:large subunit ribosomal protein L32|nr:50S ribosomal protein L32 [Endomicrobium sp.]